MGVFEFIVALVLISTVGKAVSSRTPSEKPGSGPAQLPPAEVDRIRESLHELSGRVGRLEEERDFYKQLLDAPDRKRGLPSPESGESP